MPLPSAAQLRAVAHTLEDLARARLVRRLDPERRAEQRIPFSQIMRVAPLGDAKLGTNWISVMSLNVSSMGMAFICPKSTLAVGMSVVVDCLPHRPQEIFIPGLISRVDAVLDRIWEVGVQFQFRSDWLNGVALC